MTMPSTKGSIDMLAKGFELLAEGMAKIFCSDRIEPYYKKEREKTFNTFLGEILNGNYHCSIYPHERCSIPYINIMVTLPKNKWAMSQHFLDEKSILEECFLKVDSQYGYKMKKVSIKSIKYVPSLDWLEVTFTCEEATKYQYMSDIEMLKETFKEGHILSCEEFYDNLYHFKLYGFTWEYQNGNMILHHPKD